MRKHDYSYLLKRQANAERLKRKAFEEFASARNSGRLTAFVGSYASAHLGYGDWAGMVEKFLNSNKDKAEESELDEIFEQLKHYSQHHTFSDIDIMDLGELLAKIDKHADPETYEHVRKLFGEDFKLKDKDQNEGLPNAAQQLFQELGIVRFMTLNYDLELEWQIFFTANERKAFYEDRRSAKTKKEKRQEFFDAHVDDLGGSSARLDRAIPGRGHVTSDIVSRENSAQLFEFGLWSPMLQSRILHLHGRADTPEDLLVTRRDYRDRYWRVGYSKLPFEYGMRMIFAGNPILFVGIGAKEDEVMRVLEQFLSDNPNRRAVPMFMVWNSSSPKEDAARRLLFNRKFGIHILFDMEIAELAGDTKYESHRPTPHHSAKDKAFRLIEPLRLLAKVAESTRDTKFWEPSDFRSGQSKYNWEQNSTTKWRDTNKSSSYRVDVWRHERTNSGSCGPLTVETSQNTADIDLELLEAVTKPSAEDQALVAALDIGKPIKAIIGETGSGRGAIADAIAGSYENRYKSETKGRVIVVNGAFATDTDSIFGILSGAFNQFTAQAQGVSRATATRELFDMMRGPQAPRQTIGQAIAAAASPSSTAGAEQESEEGVDEKLQAAEQPIFLKDPGGQPIMLDEGPITIIINGMERFIGHDGSALSNEVDTLVRLVINGYRQYARTKTSVEGEETKPENSKDFPIKLLLIGTQRLLRYMEIVATDSYDRLRLERKDGKTTLAIGPARFSRECSPYFDVVAKGINESPDKSRVVAVPPAYREKSSSRRTFFQNVFNGAFPEERGINKPALAFELLRTLAYIGQPIEQHVLYHVPSLLTVKATIAESRLNIDVCLRQLLVLGLVLKIDEFPGGGERFGLHKTVVAEFRERYGVPMSDSRLANGFNLSLFAAQPVDTYLPDQRWHEEIGKLLDFLIGAYRDNFEPDPDIKATFEAADDAYFRQSVFSGVHVRQNGNLSTSVARLASAEVADCLRAALSLLRSYYSVPALLMHSNRELDPWMRDGPLSEHAERIQRLLRIARQATAARRLATTLTSGRPLGPAPFYPDDLVWLNNELAVVRLTQGSLYEARRKLQEASRLNRLFVEPDTRQQNWRRIELNRLQADVDRGMIERAEDRIRDIELVVEEQALLFTTQPVSPYHSAREYIMATYAEGKSCSEFPTTVSDGRATRVDRHYPTDLVLTIAITQGYRGLTQHLRGAIEASLVSFKSALAILRNLNEQRAYSFFMRHLAAAQASCGDLGSAETSLRLCVASAGHARQTDIDHAGRIALVHFGLSHVSSDGERRPIQPIPQLSETLRYASASDMYRLQIEAMQTLARVHLRNGDADSALRFATDAAAIAARCGFGLRKVSLRILLGRIMAFRNELPAARELLESASLIATKLHYEQAVEAAEDERVRLGA
jgi:hypothetical protein